MVARAHQSTHPSIRLHAASTGLLSLVLAITIPSCSSTTTGETGSLDGGSETSTSGQLCSGKSCATGETCCATCSGKSFCSVDCPGFSCGAASQDATTSAESGATSDAAVDEGAEAGQDGCGVTIYETNRACQKWLDDNCCAEQRSCDAACQIIVACVNKCPAPPTDACLAGCFPAFGNAALDEIANCSKSVPSPPSGEQCAWPK